MYFLLHKKQDQEMAKLTMKLSYNKIMIILVIFHSNDVLGQFNEVNYKCHITFHFHQNHEREATMLA